MALIERELGVAIAATAAAMSPRARRAARQGAVYGLAGVLKAGDVVAATARGMAQGARDAASDEEPKPARASSQAGSPKSSTRKRQPAARTRSAPAKGG